MFTKAVVFSDLHFGKRSDSELHNRDCQRYITWLCEVIRKEKPDTVIFLGDYFDNQTRLRKDTNMYGYDAACQLYNECHWAGARLWWLLGNHDLFNKNKRTVHGLPWVDRLSSNDEVVLVDSPLEIDNVLLCPWLVGTEYLEVSNSEAKYVFGHFELPTFLMNEQVECFDHGGLNADMFTECDAVYTGHFHKRQAKINEHGIPITYIGNCFPHNFNDVGDTDRGCMILEWDKEPRFMDWPYAPSYHRISLSSMIELAETGKMKEHFNAQSVVECYDDLNIRQEEALEIKEVLQTELRDLTLKPFSDKLGTQTETEVERDGKTVDQIVVEHIKNLDTDGSDIDPATLLDVYRLSDES